MPSVTLERAREVKARHEQDWLKRDGVTGVDVGQRWRWRRDPRLRARSCEAARHSLRSRRRPGSVHRPHVWTALSDRSGLEPRREFPSSRFGLLADMSAPIRIC